MGYLSNKYPHLRKYLDWVKDIGFIVVFIFMALYVKNEYQNGFDNAWNQACEICIWKTTGGNQSTWKVVPINETGNITTILGIK